MADPLEFHELERIYFWLNRQRLMEQRHLSGPSLADLEECEARVQSLMVAARPGERVRLAAGQDHEKETG